MRQEAITPSDINSGDLNLNTSHPSKNEGSHFDLPPLQQEIKTELVVNEPYPLELFYARKASFEAKKREERKRWDAEKEKAYPQIYNLKE